MNPTAALRLQNCTRGYTSLLQFTLSRQKHTVVLLADMRKSDDKGHRKGLHASAPKSYPSAPALPLPHNMTQIFGNETGRFTPERARDITGPVLIYQTNTSSQGSPKTEFQDFSFGDAATDQNRSDLYTDSYDCTGAVSLNSSMQTNVPQPFSSDGKSMHLNMPGGQWARDDKYIADDMQNSHYTRSKVYSREPANGKGADANIIGRSLLVQNLHRFTQIHVMSYSTSASEKPTESQTATNESAIISESAVTKLKRAFKDYGSTVVVFHVTISLVSLGTCYVAISSGIDASALVDSLGFVDNEKIQSLLSSSSTFLIAFAVHKLLAPIRISITLATAPFLVRYLRKIGILKVK